MSTVARRFLASPARLSSTAWQTISDLITKGDSAAASEFASVKGIASSLINDQAFENHPLVVKNKGPRLRIYCLYGEDAISAEDKNEEALSWSPTAAEWHAFLPCLPDEVDEMKKLAAGKSKKFTIYNVEAGIPDDEAEEEKVAAETANTTVNWSAFENL